MLCGAAVCEKPLTWVQPHSRAVLEATSPASTSPSPVQRLWTAKPRAGSLPPSPAGCIPALEGVDVANELDE